MNVRKEKTNYAAEIYEYYWSEANINVNFECPVG